jgi:hypothetical protein
VTADPRTRLVEIAAGEEGERRWPRQEHEARGVHDAATHQLISAYRTQIVAVGPFARHPSIASVSRRKAAKAGFAPKAADLKRNRP